MSVQTAQNMVLCLNVPYCLTLVIVPLMQERDRESKKQVTGFLMKKIKTKIVHQ